MNVTLPDHIGRRIRTASSLLIELSDGVPEAPVTVYGLVTSVASGAPEAVFAPADLLTIGFVAGELSGLAVALDIPLPLLLVAAGVAQEIAADDESMANAVTMLRFVPRPDELAER